MHIWAFVCISMSKNEGLAVLPHPHPQHPTGFHCCWFVQLSMNQGWWQSESFQWCVLLFTDTWKTLPFQHSWRFNIEVLLPQSCRRRNWIYTPPFTQSGLQTLFPSPPHNRNPVR
ncbi:UNVERIFIED_CONTAM: hypothetical protein K2H54_023811 [Gekko kuhli]